MPLSDYISPETIAELGIGMHPIAGPILSGGLAIKDMKDGNYLNAALNGLGVLPFVPPMAGIIRKAKGAEMFAAKANHEKAIANGLSEQDAVVDTFHKTGVDLSAAPDHNFDAYLGGNVVSPTGKMFDGAASNPHIIKDASIPNKTAEYDFENKLIKVQPDVFKDGELFRNAVVHESQHAHDRATKGTAGYFAEYANKLAPLKQKADELKAFSLAQTVAGTPERTAAKLDWVNALKEKDRFILSSKHEVMARAAGEHAIVPRNKRELISSRVKQEEDISPQMKVYEDEATSLVESYAKETAYGEELLRLQKTGPPMISHN